METVEQLVDAIKRGDISAVKELLAAQPGLADARTGEMSVVLLAAYYQEPEIARLLASQASRLDIFEASAVGLFDRVQELAGAQPELAQAFAADGFQPLGLASFFEHADVAAYLISLGAPVNSASQNGMKVMPLHSAVARGNLEISRMLLMAGADVNARQADDYSPLHEAAQNGQLEMVRLLLDYGADPLALMAGGRTPRDVAVEHNHPEVAAYLEKL